MHFSLWTRATWATLVHTAAQINNPVSASVFVQFVQALTLVLPCEACRAHCASNLVALRLQEVSTRTQALGFVQALRNKVNPAHSLSQADQAAFVATTEGEMETLVWDFLFAVAADWDIRGNAPGALPHAFLPSMAQLWPRRATTPLAPPRPPAPTLLHQMVAWHNVTLPHATIVYETVAARYVHSACSVDGCSQETATRFAGNAGLPHPQCGCKRAAAWGTLGALLVLVVLLVVVVGSTLWATSRHKH
jgi:hypothetical protein